jgi:TrmH RNA methyltransferase
LGLRAFVVKNPDFSGWVKLSRGSIRLPHSLKPAWISRQKHRMKPSFPLKTRELNVCGWQAVSTLFARHPAEVRRLFFDAATGRRAGEFCSLLAQQKKVYRQVESAELEKVAGSLHHGGIVAVIGERPMKKVTREVLDTWGRTKAPLLLLDRVSNANNLGAIVRTAAFFGVRAIIVPDHPAQALPGEAAYRVAEGGMEFVDFYRVPSLPGLCAELQRHHFLIGTSLRGNQLSPSAAKERGLPRPPAVILGNEEKGMSPEVAAKCDRLVKIPGTDAVESLNVSAAAAVLCWEFFGKR